MIFAFVSVHSVHALSFPSGISNYVALNISNSQSTATPNPFQQMINISSSDNGWTYINTNQTTAFGQNVEFFYANGTIIPSWLENYTSTHALWWVKVGSIAANSKLTIYMGFANKTTNLFNNKTTGEAPQLSSTYAEYDDGANVFTNYWNFAGTSLPSGWNVSGTDYSVNNGISISGSSPATYIQTSNTYNPETQIVDIYSYVNGLDNSGDYFQGYAQSGAGEPQYLISDRGGGGTSYTLTNYNGTESAVDIAGGSTTSYQVWSVWISTTESYATLNYGTPATLSTDFTAETSAYILLFQTNSNTQYTKWVDVRAYPPNGVMPSVSFGSVQSTTITLYLNGVSDANTSITYGTQSNFTAVISLSTDYVSLYVNGTKVVSLTQGKAIYLKTLATRLLKEKELQG